ncbi:hypothetical protein H2198_003941 [Neophaeococcomyces mojaviensis]|uniref:Uncharacterized protein n=1 Tax=Neophaeococcomyces mojaviensis TaxID=3383035 RepID=A0ACC3AA13_9EURO|nr:hypothetical protein H2198_003941 [Knufia sp. JES_112]
MNTATALTDLPPESHSEALSTGAKAGIGVGVGVGVFLGVVLTIWIYRVKRRKRRTSTQLPHEKAQLHNDALPRTHGRAELQGMQGIAELEGSVRAPAELLPSEVHEVR